MHVNYVIFHKLKTGIHPDFFFFPKVLFLWILLIILWKKNIFVKKYFIFMKNLFIFVNWCRTCNFRVRFKVSDFRERSILRSLIFVKGSFSDPFFSWMNPWIYLANVSSIECTIYTLSCSLTNAHTHLNISQ